MDWKSLFRPVSNMTAEEARAFLAARPEGSYQLIDVRQPREYADGHLAGARLLPLKELADRVAELDAAKPTLVYCAVGGRSKVAAQLLNGKGFRNVFNILGGIKAWQGGQAVGPEELGLDLFTGGMDYADAAALSYAMEDGLQRFYRALEEKSEPPAWRQLLARLAGFEDRHKERLLAEYRRRRGDDAGIDPGSAPIMEGGRRIDEYLKRADALLRSLPDILQLAMTLETQAMDLYSRMAQKSEDRETRDFFLSMAEEEKTHLAYLAEEMDRVLAAG
ncbi:MAG: rhodanese-like domain-containing protein [Thermodesulfobacteriota bacterium]